MNPDPKITDMRRRILRWLNRDMVVTTTAAEGDEIGALDADIKAFEAELQSLFRSGGATAKTYDALREQAVLRTVLESMVEGVVVADMDARFLVFNEAARRLLGKGPVETGPADWSEAYGVFLADGKTLCPPERLPLSRALKGESIDGDELVIRSPDRAPDCYISATGRPLSDDHGCQIGAVVVFHDISEYKVVERELRRARESAEDSARVKSEFLANMSHEIRTPLTAVLGFADLLLDPNLGESEKLNYIQAVRRNGEHLLALINDVLDLSKIHANKISVERIDCALHQVLTEATSVMQVRAYEKGLLFDVVYETPIPVIIESNAMRVRQILLNLLSNAIKFTSHGQVRLSARCAGHGTPSARVELSVSDTGIGLSAEEINGLFQPFQQANASTTRQYGGTGLGLSICRALAEALGGEITVHSVAGEGSTFTFILYQPLDEQRQWVDSPGQAQEERVDIIGKQPANTLSGRILLAEDGLDNQLLLSTILRRQGLEVDIADNGAVAVTQALAALQSNAPFDLILMDMQMPELDGYGATAKLRAKGYSAPIIALTAHAMGGERERCMRAGCDDYLTKPIARHVLLAVVESYLHRVRGGSPVQTTISVGAKAKHSNQEVGPLHSCYANDPEMGVLITGFVDRLATQIENIRAAADDYDLARLGRLAHQLKGAAGGYGFMPVSHQAEALEKAARDATRASELTAVLDRLASTCERVRKAEGCS